MANVPGLPDAPPAVVTMISRAPVARASLRLNVDHVVANRARRDRTLIGREVQSRLMIGNSYP